jgi:hypothetical protein
MLPQAVVDKLEIAEIQELEATISDKGKLESLAFKCGIKDGNESGMWLKMSRLPINIESSKWSEQA